jgi:hypothetical protein
MFFVDFFIDKAFIDKSDRFADLPYSTITKMASVREYDFNKNNS